MKIIETKVYQYSELTEEAKVKALDWYSQHATDFDWWEDEGLLDVEQSKWVKYGLKDCLFKWDKIYFDIDPNYSHLEFVNLRVTDKEVFRKALGVPKRLWAKLYPSFVRVKCDYRNHETRLLLESDSDGRAWTDKQKEIITNAEKRFDDWRQTALLSLEKQYEYLQGRESMEESIEANGYEFTEDGKRF